MARATPHLLWETWGPQCAPEWPTWVQKGCHFEAQKWLNWVGIRILKLWPETLHLCWLIFSGLRASRANPHLVCPYSQRLNELIPWCSVLIQHGMHMKCSWSECFPPRQTCQAILSGTFENPISQRGWPTWAPKRCYFEAQKSLNEVGTSIFRL